MDLVVPGIDGGQRSAKAEVLSLEAIIVHRFVGMIDVTVENCFAGVIEQVILRVVNRDTILDKLQSPFEWPHGSPCIPACQA
jgi:hypothetical protein